MDIFVGLKFREINYKDVLKKNHLRKVRLIQISSQTEVQIEMKRPKKTGSQVTVIFN